MFTSTKRPLCKSSGLFILDEMTMTKVQFEIPIDNQLSMFQNHLDNPQNERIIFSGIFGIGKSYFLEKYFEMQAGKYLAISLAPVNYSISNNEDIFGLIKYDILYELIVKHELELESEAISRHIAYGTILSSKADSLLEGLLNIAPILNKGIGLSQELPNPAPFVSFLKKIIPQIEKIEKQRKDANLNQRVMDYIKELGQSALFESDFITGFIIESLERLATQSEQRRKKVLIIDDLDRIDPEHIFRLFNIFSSHISHGKLTSNKFGFDKVIFVCDVENIRNIFAARYGASTDFSGYIDKFYSSEIFYFNNSQAVSATTEKIIQAIKFEENSTYAAAFLKNLDHGHKGLLNFFIRTGINSGILSLRKIKSIMRGSYNISEHTLPLQCKQSITNINFPAIVALEVMIKFYGGIESFEKALQRMNSFKKSRHSNFSEYSQATDDLNIIGYFIPILDYEQHEFKIDRQINRSSALEYTFKNIKINYELTTFNNMEQHYYARIFPHNHVNYSFVIVDIIQEAFNKLLYSGYFNSHIID